MKAKRKRSLGRWIVVLLLCIPAGYIGLQLFQVAHRSYTTQSAVAYRMADTLTCKGVLGTQETEVAWAPDTGTLSYIAYNGERVSPGTTVAQVFTSPAAAESFALYRKLAREVEVLKESQASLASFSLDIESLARQEQNALYDILDTVDTGNYAGLADTRGQLQLVQNKIQANTGVASDFTPRLNELTAQRDAALAAGSSVPVAAPVAGYFVSGQDSQKKQFTLDQLNAMTPAEIEAAAAQPPAANDGAVAGKLIQDYHWRFYMAVSTAYAGKFQEGDKSLTISFPSISDEEFPVQVESVVTDEEAGLVKVVLLCNYINGTIITQEQAEATIAFTVYEGLRIPAQARHTVEGQDCVYVKFGNKAYKCPIQILYEDENYLLVSDKKVKGQNEVELYDEIIVKGMDLYDGKVLD